MEEDARPLVRFARVRVAAASRILARLRTAFNDPLLVRAGRGLVPTPRALELRDGVHAVVADAHNLFLRERTGHLGALHRTFNIRTDESIANSVAEKIIASLREKAPLVKVRFLQRSDREAGALREGIIDIDVGAGVPDAPEIKSQLLLRDRFIGIARIDHPIMRGRITPQKYARYPHVNVSRRGIFSTAIDSQLARRGLSRDVVMVLPGFFGAITAVAQSDMLAAVPEHVLLLSPPFPAIQSFQLPLELERIRLVQSWHPRFDKDAAHVLLRNVVKEVLTSRV